MIHLVLYASYNSYMTEQLTNQRALPFTFQNFNKTFLLPTTLLISLFLFFYLKLNCSVSDISIKFAVNSKLFSMPGTKFYSPC